MFLRYVDIVWSSLTDRNKLFGHYINIPTRACMSKRFKRTPNSVQSIADVRRNICTLYLIANFAILFVCICY